MKSEGLLYPCNQEKSLALHIYWTTTPKDGRIHDFWFVEGRVCVSSLLLAFTSFYSPSIYTQIVSKKIKVQVRTWIDGGSVKAAGGWRLAAGCWLVAAVLRLVAAFLDLLEYLLKELNCWKHLYVGLDASEWNLDSFLHATCLLAEFSCHLWKIISPSYDIVFDWYLERL